MVFIKKGSKTFVEAIHPTQYRIVSKNIKEEKLCLGYFDIDETPELKITDYKPGYILLFTPYREINNKMIPEDYKPAPDSEILLNKYPLHNDQIQKGVQEYLINKTKEKCPEYFLWKMYKNY